MPVGRPTKRPPWGPPKLRSRSGENFGTGIIFKDLHILSVLGPRNPVALAGQTRLMTIRDHPRFFDQVGQQTTNASIGNKHFSLNNDLVRLTKIMNNLQRSQNSEFQSHF